MTSAEFVQQHMPYAGQSSAGFALRIIEIIDAARALEREICAQIAANYDDNAAEAIRRKPDHAKRHLAHVIDTHGIEQT